MKKIVFLFLFIAIVALLGCESVQQPPIVDPNWDISVSAWRTTNQIFNFESTPKSDYIWLGCYVTITNTTAGNQNIHWSVSKDLAYYLAPDGNDYDWMETQMNTSFQPYQSITDFIYIRVPRNVIIGSGSINFSMANGQFITIPL